MKIRIKFRKYGLMRFIGHLDMMRYFQKAMRRADIDIAYSEGFSPHQIMSFAAPLGVGITSNGEYFDIEVHSSRSSKEALRALNEVMVEGVQVTEYKRLPDHAPNAMSSVAASSYTVHYKDPLRNPFSLPALKEAIKDFYDGQEEILMTKQTKKSQRILNLKPLIYQLEGVEEANPGFALQLSAGSGENIKPELVLEAFYDYLKRKEWEIHPGYCSMNMQIHRLEVYTRDEKGGFLPLGGFGEDIL